MSTERQLIESWALAVEELGLFSDDPQLLEYAEIIAKGIRRGQQIRIKEQEDDD